MGLCHINLLLFNIFLTLFVFHNKAYLLEIQASDTPRLDSIKKVNALGEKLNF